MYGDNFGDKQFLQTNTSEVVLNAPLLHT